MSKKKQNIDEGMIMISSLLPVGPRPTLSMRGNKKDNFTFKGLPSQFNENGEKIMDENGEPINESFTFTKKYYIMIANILKTSKNVYDVAHKIADMFEKDNPLFKKDVFLKASGE